MSSPKSRLAACGFVMALALTAASPAALASSAFAADPIDPSVGVDGGVVSGTPNEGLTADQIKHKMQEVKDFAATHRGTHAPAKKLGAGARVNATGGTSPSSVITDSAGHTIAVYIDYYPGFYQKTNYYCVVAVIQSIAYFDLDSWYRTMGTTSIKGAQDRLFYGYRDPRTGIAYAAMGNLTARATSDSKAMSWMNAQFRLSRYAYAFYYVADAPAVLADFTDDVMLDVWAYYEASYVRVDLYSSRYAWFQERHRDGSHPIHATLSVGYNDSTKIMISYDPFSHLESGKCSHSYDASHDWGCNWTIPSDGYFRAIDNSQRNPVWV